MTDGDDSRSGGAGKPTAKRRAVLAGLGTAAVGSFAGCSSDDEDVTRDVTLSKSNWITPWQFESIAATGYVDYQAVTEFTGEDEEAPTVVGFPLVSESIMDTTWPLLDDAEESFVYGENMPAMASIRTSQSTLDMSFANVFQLPDGLSGDEYREFLTDYEDNPKSFGEAREMSIMGPAANGVEMPDTGYNLREAFVVEDDLLIHGLNFGEATSMDLFDLFERVLETAGDPADLSDDPAAHMTEMDLVNSYTYTFLGGPDPQGVASCYGVDLSNSQKRHVNIFENESRAAEALSYFEIGRADDGDDPDLTGKVVINDDGSKFPVTMDGVRYDEIRQEGDAVVFDGEITDFGSGISERGQVWNLDLPTGDSHE